MPRAGVERLNRVAGELAWTDVDWIGLTLRFQFEPCRTADQPLPWAQ